MPTANSSMTAIYHIAVFAMSIGTGTGMESLTVAAGKKKKIKTCLTMICNDMSLQGQNQ
jgi:hypothetical protein